MAEARAAAWYLWLLLPPTGPSKQLGHLLLAGVFRFAEMSAESH